MILKNSGIEKEGGGRRNKSDRGKRKMGGKGRDVEK